MMNKSIEEIVEFLIDKKLTITTAESCTGGLIAQRITSVPGASEVFGYGFVTYWEAAKARLVGVEPDVIAKYNVVSAPVAAQMAQGAAQAAGAESGRDGSGCRKNGAYHDRSFIHRRCRTGRRYEGASGRRRISWVLLQRQRYDTTYARMRQPHRNTTAGSSSSIFTLRKNADRGEDTMRIIAGTARSLPLKTIEGKDTRPTTDRIKETLFNIIQMDVPRASFLDLFAGSGAIGLEALSRGAEEAVFVENNKKAADCIEENIRFTKFTEESTLMRTDVLTALCQLEGRKYFDIVFMDPPYGKELEKEVLTYLATSKLIDEDSLIIVEMSDRTTFDYVHELGFTVEKLKKYKTNMHLFLKRAGQKED